jgi:hypothetical protein
MLGFGFVLFTFALGNNSSLELRAEWVRQVVDFVITINLDGHLSGVADHVAVMAPLEMLFQFNPGCRVHSAV